MLLLSESHKLYVEALAKTNKTTARHILDIWKGETLEKGHLSYVHCLNKGGKGKVQNIGYKVFLAPQTSVKLPYMRIINTVGENGVNS